MISTSLVSISTILIALTMYTSVNYIVKEKYFGLAYGIL
jgi:hypothetical protein